MAGPTNETPAGGRERPRYEILRDQLISEIKSGVYPAGSLLPSVREITVKWTVSTTTARKVLTELVAAGYARSEGTRGHISSGPTPAPAAAPSESAPSAPASLTIRPQQVVPLGGGLEATTTAIDVRAEPAPPEAALALRLSDPRSPVIVRRSLAVDADGTALQLQISYTLRDVAEGTPLAASSPIDAPWFQALAEHSGQQPALTGREISARHPTDSEAAMLALAPTACVLVRNDLASNEQGQPIDYTVTIWPGDSTRLTALPNTHPHG